MKDLFRVEGRVIVITGAAGILGSAMVRHFAEQGARVVILDRNPLRCDPKSLRDVTVVETIKGGRTVYRR